MRARGKWAWTVGLLLLASSASAETSRRVAMCPWTFGPGFEGSEPAAQTEVRTAAGKALELAPAEVVEKLLASKPCEAATEVLAPLAAQSASAYAFYGHASVSKGKLIISWRLTSNAGRTVAPRPATRAFEIPLKGRSALEAVQSALPGFFTDVVAPRVKGLELDTDTGAEPPTPVPEAATPVTASQKPAPVIASKPAPVQVAPATSPAVSKPAPETEGSGSARNPLPGLRLAGWVVAGLGVAAEAAALGVDLSAATERYDIKNAVDSEGRVPSGKDSIVAEHGRVVAKDQAMTALLIGGGAAIVVGGAMLVVSYTVKDSDRKAVSLSISPAGLGAVVHGKF